MRFANLALALTLIVSAAPSLAAPTAVEKRDDIETDAKAAMLLVGTAGVLAVAGAKAVAKKLYDKIPKFHSSPPSTRSIGSRDFHPELLGSIAAGLFGREAQEALDAHLRARGSSVDEIKARSGFPTDLVQDAAHFDARTTFGRDADLLGL